jgi:hypothetical protein
MMKLIGMYLQVLVVHACGKEGKLSIYFVFLLCIRLDFWDGRSYKDTHKF